MAEKPGRWDAYEHAVLRIEAPGGAIWVRRMSVLRTAGEYPDPDGRTIYVITAHNPGGRLAPGAENAAAQARLAAELERRGLTWWPAAGGNPSWKHVEASAAVVGIDAADAIALGTQFGQDAIFALSPRYRQILGCAGRRVTSTGWSIEPEPDVAAAAGERWLPEWVTASVEEDKADDARDSEPRDEPAVSAEDPRASHDSVPQQTTEPADLPDAGGAASERAAARRAEDRSQRVADGLAELSEWLRDQVRVGLAASAHAAGKKSGGAAEMAARMVDAQAPGVAGSLRGLSRLPGTGVDWPSRMLGSYAMLNLLIRAHERLDALPDGLAATVRARVGYRIGRKDVLARPAITDHWLVLGRRDLAEGAVPGRRIWLRGQDTGRFAMVLTFARNEYGSWQDWHTATLAPGTLLHASLHYYPGEPPMRAIIGERHAAPVMAKPPVPDRDIDAMLTDYAAGIEQDPWLTMWPVVLDGTPMPPEADSGEPWYLVDQTGTALPLAAEQASPWKLLVVSDGQPVTVAGEWHPGGLVLLTAWQEDDAVML